MPKKKTVTESPSNAVSGLGEHVVELKDESGQVVAFVGIQNGEERIHFSKVVSPEQVEAVSELLQKKKFTKHISKQRFDDAQAFADRKF